MHFARRTQRISLFSLLCDTTHPTLTGSPLGFCCICYPFNKQINTWWSEILLLKGREWKREKRALVWRVKLNRYDDSLRWFWVELHGRNEDELTENREKAPSWTTKRVEFPRCFMKLPSSWLNFQLQIAQLASQESLTMPTLSAFPLDSIMTTITWLHCAPLQLQLRNQRSFAVIFLHISHPHNRRKRELN